MRTPCVAIIWVLFLPLSSIASGIPKGAIAFAAEHEGGLHYIQPLSAQVHNVAFDQMNVGELAYSHERRQLAFFASKSHGGRESLYLMDTESGRLSVVLSARQNRKALHRPAFDPSGHHLYALNYSAGIFRYSFKERRWQEVKVVGRDSLHPQGLSFSKSGRRAAISHERFAGLLIAQVSDSGIAIEREVLTDFDSVISPRWSSDDVLVFAGRRRPGLQFLWKLDLNSGAVEQLTSSPIAARDFLSLSDDGKTVVFTGTKEGEPLEWRLWEMPIRNGTPTQLTSGGELSSHLFPTFIE